MTDKLNNNDKSKNPPNNSTPPLKKDGENKNYKRETGNMVRSKKEYPDTGNAITLSPSSMGNSTLPFTNNPQSFTAKDSTIKNKLLNGNREFVINHQTEAQPDIEDVERDTSWSVIRVGADKRVRNAVNITKSEKPTKVEKRWMVVNRNEERNFIEPSISSSSDADNNTRLRKNLYVEAAKSNVRLRSSRTEKSNNKEAPYVILKSDTKVSSSEDENNEMKRRISGRKNGPLPNRDAYNNWEIEYNTSVGIENGTVRIDVPKQPNNSVSDNDFNKVYTVAKSNDSGKLIKSKSNSPHRYYCSDSDVPALKNNAELVKNTVSTIAKTLSDSDLIHHSTSVNASRIPTYNSDHKTVRNTNNDVLVGKIVGLNAIVGRSSSANKQPTPHSSSQTDALIPFKINNDLTIKSNDNPSSGNKSTDIINPGSSNTKMANTYPINTSDCRASKTLMDITSSPSSETAQKLAKLKKQLTTSPTAKKIFADRRTANDTTYSDTEGIEAHVSKVQSESDTSGANSSMVCERGESEDAMNSTLHSVSSSVCQECVKRYISQERIRGEHECFKNPEGPPAWKTLTGILVPGPTEAPPSFAPSRTQTAPQTSTSGHVTLDLKIPDAPPECQEDPSTSANIGGIMYTGLTSSISAGISALANLPSLPHLHEPLNHHWFFDESSEDGKRCWVAFSKIDSSSIENVFLSGKGGLVSTDGGRCDCDVGKRVKYSAYTPLPAKSLIRASWYLVRDSSYTPFSEKKARWLEELYQDCQIRNKWNVNIEDDDGSTFVFKSHTVIYHFSDKVDTTHRYSLNRDISKEDLFIQNFVKRGLDDNFVIPYNENDQIDHVIFVVHGIGEGCDLKSNSIYDCTNGIRRISNDTIRKQYPTHHAEGLVDRIEYIPVMWYDKLHRQNIGIDGKLKPITLPSIQKLRDFTNNTLLDAIFYSSPSYRKKISEIVINEINRLHRVFMLRNDHYLGSFSLIGHSLGSIILFDILSNEKIPNIKENLISKERIARETEVMLKKLNLEEYSDLFKYKAIDIRSLSNRDLQYLGVHSEHSNLMSDYIASLKLSTNRNASDQCNDCLNNYNSMGLTFSPRNLFALGSPIAMFLSARDNMILGPNYSLPTCPGFFNIFHPYDPVAFRIEPFLGDCYSDTAYTIPHHTGRKRFHIELKEGITRVSEDLKNRFFSSFNVFSSNAITPSVIKDDTDNDLCGVSITSPQISATTNLDMLSISDPEMGIGKLNGTGRRVDFVLQESPLESLNEYVFALSSHMCYWNSNDTILFIVKEVYSMYGIHFNGLDPIVSASNKLMKSKRKTKCRDDEVQTVAPPPLSGFKKRSEKM